LEQPFKDNAKNPDPYYGWSPEKAMMLGSKVLEALEKILSKL